METVRRQLEPAVTGHTIVRASVTDALVVAPRTPAWFRNHIKGESISAVDRRGKYLVFRLDSGRWLVIHLRMTGVLTYVGNSNAEVSRRHLRMTLHLDNGAQMTFHDQRRFGKALIVEPAEQAGFWRHMGPEPLQRSFNARALQQIIEGKKRPVKSLLLDQSAIAGIGNIYADEALFEARIHPLRPAESLSAQEAADLSQSIKKTLRKAISHEGSSIDTYRTASGGRGRFQETFRVHRREGEPCPVCGGAVTKIKVGGRGTYFCPRCQR